MDPFGGFGAVHQPWTLLRLHAALRLSNFGDLGQDGPDAERLRAHEATVAREFAAIEKIDQESAATKLEDLMDVA